MNLRQPRQESITDRIIDNAFQHTAGLYHLRKFLETGNWNKSFGIGGYSGREYRWDGNADGIQYSLPEDGVKRKIKPVEIMARAKQWQQVYSPGEQIKLF